MNIQPIVEANISDVPQVAAIARASFEDPWPEEAFRAELDYVWSLFTVFKRPCEDSVRQGVLGFILCWRMVDELHLLNLAVEPGFRRQGIARALVEDAISRWQKEGGASVLLEVRASNQTAQAFYRSLGFSQIAERKHYYQNNREHALVMFLKTAEQKEASLG